jgi:hypothetical protein
MKLSKEIGNPEPLEEADPMPEEVLGEEEVVASKADQMPFPREEMTSSQAQEEQGVAGDLEDSIW